MNKQPLESWERGREPLGTLPAGSHPTAPASRRRGATFFLTLLALLWGWMLLPAAASANPLDLKVSVSDDPVVRGQGFFYRLMATNTHPASGAPLENVTIRWIVPADLRWFSRSLITGVSSFPYGSCNACYPGNLLIMNLGTLLPGESREVQIPVSISPDLPAADLPRALLAEFEGTYTGGGQFLAAETVTIAFAKSLEVALSATPTPLAPNGELTYTLTFGNTGQQAVANADLTLQLPTNVTVLDNGGGLQTGNRIIWSITQLNAGISDRRQVRVRDTAGAVNRVLAAQVEIDDRIGVGPDARMSLLTPVRASRPLQVSLAVSADPIKRGQGLFYRLTATNTHPASGAPLENVTIRWIVPADLRWFSRSLITGVSSFPYGSCNACYPGNLLIMNLGTLLPGESREVQIPITASADAPFGRLIPVRLFGNYDTDSREWAVAAETVAIEQSKSLDIKLSAAPAPVAPGSPFVYELIYGNTGASAINGALELTLPPGIQVLDGDGGLRIGNTLIWDRIGPLGSGQGDRRQVRIQNSSGDEGRLLPAEARLIDNANPKSWAARTAFATAARTNRPLNLAAALSKDPLASGDTFRYTLTARNTNPSSGAPLENVTIQWIVPADLRWFSRSLITGVSSFPYGSCNACYPGNLLIMNLGTLLPGESREVQIPVTLENNIPAGTLLDAHFVGDAALPNGVGVQQVVATATALVGQYLPAVPAKPTTISPSGAITTNRPTYTWNAVSGATSYQLWVNDSTGNRIATWYTAAQTNCAGGTGTCSIAPAVSLSPGAATWWVQGWNASGYGPWSDGRAFTVPAAGPPAKPTLLAPSGVVTTNQPTYSWNAVGTATWYRLWVNDATGNKIATWYTAAQTNCAGGAGTCSIKPAISLAAGTATWWVQGWNPSGEGPWSDGRAFSVSTP